MFYLLNVFLRDRIFIFNKFDKNFERKCLTSLVTQNASKLCLFFGVVFAKCHNDTKPHILERHVCKWRVAENGLQLDLCRLDRIFRVTSTVWL